MTKTSTIILQKENMKFSCAHFTVFSEMERENLHGHNYSVGVEITTDFDDLGLEFNYDSYKKAALTICESLDDTVLLAGNCKYLTFSEDERYHIVEFHDEKMFFLKRDATIIDVRNISVEELSHWFIEKLIATHPDMSKHRVRHIKATIYSAAGQGGYSTWEP